MALDANKGTWAKVKHGLVNYQELCYPILCDGGRHVICWSEPEEPCRPLTYQFAFVRGVIALDIIVLIVIRQFIRSRGTNADPTAS